MRISFAFTVLLAHLSAQSVLSCSEARTLREYEPDECSVFFHDALKDSEHCSSATWGCWSGREIRGNLSGCNMEDFQSHRSGKSGFSFSVPNLRANKKCLVRLGFAEVHTPNCEVGKRVMDIHVNGQEFATDLDVHRQAGCENALVLERAMKFSTDDVQILFETSIENPMTVTLGTVGQQQKNTPCKRFDSSCRRICQLCGWMGGVAWECGVGGCGKSLLPCTPTKSSTWDMPAQHPTRHKVRKTSNSSVCVCVV